MKTTISLIVITLFGLDLMAQKSLDLDLNLMAPGDTLFFTENNSYDEIKLINTFPFDYYYIEIKKETNLLPPLSLPEMGVSAKHLPLDITINECPELARKFNDLFELSIADSVLKKKYTEVTIAERRIDLQSEIDKNICQKNSLIDSAETLLNYFIQTKKQHIKIGAGDKVIIRVYRKDKTKTWTWVFKGEETGKWVTTYGFGFTFEALEGGTYYTKQLEDSADFVILKSDKPKPLDLNYIPAIFFSFFPSQNFNKCWNHSLTAGLGFDLAAPVVFLGYNGMFYHNIGLSVGIAMLEQSRLKSQY